MIPYYPANTGGLLPLTAEEERELLAKEGIYDPQLGESVPLGAGTTGSMLPTTQEGFPTFPDGTTAPVPLNLQGAQFNVVADAAKKANQYALQTAIQDRKRTQAAHESDMTAFLMSMATGQRIGSQGNSLRSGTSNTASNLAHQQRLKNAAISKGLVAIIDKFSDQIKSKKDVENLILAVPGLDIDQRKDLRAELNEWKEEDFKPMTAFVDGKVKVIFRRPGDLNKEEREAGYTFDMEITNALKGQGEAEMVGNALNKFSAYFSNLPESERTRRTALTWTAREGYYRNPVIMSAIRDLVGDLIPKPAYETRYFPGKNGAMEQRTVSSETPLGKGEVRSLEHAQQNAKTLHQKIQEEVITANSGLKLNRLLDMYRVRMQENPGLMALLEGTVADREQAFLNRVTAAQTQAATVVKAEADAMDAAAGVMTGGSTFSYKVDDGGNVITNPQHSDHDSRDWLTKTITKEQLLKDARSIAPKFTPINGYFPREGAVSVSTWDKDGRRVDALKDVHGNILQPSVATPEGYGTLVYIKQQEDGTNKYVEAHYSNPAMKAALRDRLLNENVDPTTIYEKGSAQDRFTPNDSHDWHYAKIPSVVDTTTTDPATGAITVTGQRPDTWEKRYTTKFATEHLRAPFKDQIKSVKGKWEEVDASIDKIRGLIELESELVDVGVLDAQLITLWKKLDDKSMVTESEFQTIKDAASFQAGMRRSYESIKDGAQLTYGQRLAILLSAQLVMISGTDKYRQRLNDINNTFSSHYPLAPSPNGETPSYIDLMAPGIQREFKRIDESLGYIDQEKGVDLPILDRMVRNNVINDRNRAVLSKGYGDKDGAWGAKATKQVRSPGGKLTTVPTTRPKKVKGF